MFQIIATYPPEQHLGKGLGASEHGFLVSRSLLTKERQQLPTRQFLHLIV